jgi:hypothetical protein
MNQETVISKKFEYGFMVSFYKKILKNLNYMQRYKSVLLGLYLLNLVGCVTVQPWEKEILARPEMSWTPDSIEVAMENHIFFSKEGSTGGGSAAGGGCGCN